MHLDALRNGFDSFRGFAIDTTFVLFFLGLEFGTTLQQLTFDAFLLFITMLMVAILPYYLPSNSERPGLAKWLAGRGLIAVFAIALGAILSPAYGTIFPESFKFMPLTLLIIAAMSSCFIQFYGLMRLRLAK
jgi:hypothetical protein